jgi:DNA-binding transcriptional MerR regulator
VARSEEPRKLYKTAEVVKKAGITRQMLYTYTTMGLVEEATKTPTGHKLYGESIFKRLKLIHDLHDSGYTLRDIQELFGPRLCK